MVPGSRIIDHTAAKGFCQICHPFSDCSQTDDTPGHFTEFVKMICKMRKHGIIYILL